MPSTSIHQALSAPNTHVVGHQVEQQPQVECTRGACEADEAGHAAQFGVDLRRVDDIVAVQAAGARTGDRRTVDMAHAQPLQVGQHGTRRVEVEALVQLHPIGGVRQHRPWQVERRRRSVAVHDACLRRKVTSSRSTGVAPLPGACALR
jgi:hypothetical protein